MNIFCSGIGGIGLSAYARHMKARGHTVSGSDAKESALIAALRQGGIDVATTQDGAALPATLDLLVYSEAIPADAPERRLAQQRGVRSLSYFGAVGEMTRDASTCICIAGTHGKSTTTAMIAKLFIDAGKDPNVILGTLSRELDGQNWRTGTGPWIIEACEYRRSFLSLHPTTIVLTTVDGDHFDAFRDRDDYHAAFREFIARLPTHAPIIVHGSDPDILRVIDRESHMVIDADSHPAPTLSIPGEHMRQNAQLVLALAQTFGIPDSTTRQSLASFHGTWRRMEHRGRMSTGALVIDDYAHHPKEIQATLQAIHESHPGAKIHCIFQPHTHDRTLALWDDFAGSFYRANTVVVPDIYGARAGSDRSQADPALLVSAIQKSSKVPAVFVQDLDGAATWATEHANNGDVVVLMGAGTVTSLAERLTGQTSSFFAKASR